MQKVILIKSIIICNSIEHWKNVGVKKFYVLGDPSKVNKFGCIKYLLNYCKQPALEKDSKAY